MASLQLELPAGIFARSHIAGAGLNYSSYHRWFGKDVHTLQWIGLTVQAGAIYYLNKNITAAGYTFRYSSYVYIYAMAGIITNPWVDTSISSTAGPAFGIYKRYWNTGMGASLGGLYYLSDRITIGPAISFKKFAQQDALWSGMVQIGYSF